MDWTKYAGKISNSGGDEYGGIKGGKAGDQTGNEWNIRSWYNRPWSCVLRYPDEKVRDLIAELAIEAAENNNIGYDQGQRQTYWEQLQKVGYRPKNIKTPCEADCSAGVIANTKAAGALLGIPKLENIPATYTGNMRNAFQKAGFEVLTDKKYLTSPDYLLPGDILLNDSHHTATNLGIGSKVVHKEEPEQRTNIVIDVSVHNGTIDWRQTKAAIAGAIIRCGYGVDEPDQDDKLYKANVLACERYGIPYAVYLYSYAYSTVQAASEAAHALRLVEGHKPAVIYFDSEQSGTQNVARANAEVFIRKIRQAGYKAGVYASSSWYKHNLNGIECDSLWIAAYGTNDGTAQEKYRPNLGEDLWQYTSVGTIPGSSHKTDMNIMYRDIFGGVAPSPTPDQPTDLLELVAQTMEGKYGNGDDRVKYLGKNYTAVQDMINHIYKTSAAELAKEVISGKYGNGELRKRVLGPRYAEVQAAVNRALR